MYKIYKFLVRLLLAIKFSSKTEDEIYIDKLVNIMNYIYGVKLEQIKSKDKSMFISTIRHLFIFVLFEKIRDHSYIANIIDRHRTTVIASLNKSKDLMFYDKDFMNKYKEIKELL